MAFTARLFTKNFGAGSVRHLHTRFTGAARLGDTVVLSATLTGTDNAVGLYDVDARTTASDELMSGKARVTNALSQ
jgi:hypothetical protein